MADAGLAPARIDGVISGHSLVERYTMYGHVLSEYLGISPRACATLDSGGATACAGTAWAASAVRQGTCEAVLVVHGDNRGSVARGGWGRTSTRIGEVIAHPEFEAPYGLTPPAASALRARLHMERYGTTREQLAAIAVAMRAHAARNPKALRRSPIAVADVLASTPVADPLHGLDCALISDFGGAVVVTTLEICRALGRVPVRLLGTGEGTTHKYVAQAPDLLTCGARASGERALAEAGVAPIDIDLALLYDAFTVYVLILLEDLGFCAPGEAGALVASGALGPGGALPCNTHGGMLSGAHGGSLHLTEAVRQLRGEAGPERQVAGARLALVHGSGGSLSSHTTLVLGAA